MKRFLYLVIIVAVIALVVLAGYYLRYRAGSTPTAPEEAASGGLGSLPAAPNQSTIGQIAAAGGNTKSGLAAGAAASGGQFGLMADSPVADYFVDPQNNVYIVQPDGQIAEINGGQPIILSSSAISNLNGASFSYDGKKIMASFGGPASPQQSVFDVQTKSWQPLDSGIQSASWSPNDYEIAYFGQKNGLNALTTADISNPKAKPQNLLALNVRDALINWAAPGEMFLYEKSSALFAGEAFAYDLKKKTIANIVPDRVGLDILWDKSGSQGLIFVGTSLGRGGELGIIDNQGTLLHRLAFLTLPSKCAFEAEGGAPTPAASAPAASSSAQKKSGQASSAAAPPAQAQMQNEFLFCAIPRDPQQFKSNSIPDAYEEREIFTTDDIYKVNLSSGDLQLFFDGSTQNIDAENLSVFNQKLFFVNRYDRKLYAISLR